MQRWPVLAKDTEAYREVWEALPEAWHLALRAADTHDEKGEEVWYRVGEKYVRRYTQEGRPATATREEIPARRLTCTYEKEDGTAKLRPTEEPKPARTHPIPREAVECCVRKTHVNDKIGQSWDKKDSRELRNARARRWTHEVYGERCETCYHPLDELSVQPPGLSSRMPVQLMRLRERHAKEMLRTEAPSMPRAWDARDANQHYATLYAGLTPTEFQRTMARTFKAIRHHVIPPHIRDVLYKTLVSGHRIGPNKQKNDEARCPRGQCSCVESIEHAYADCEQGVRQLWEVVVRRWNTHTGQTLDARDRRVTLLGDRGEQAHAMSEPLWRMVHAATIWIVHRTQKEAREAANAGRLERSTSEQRVLARVRRTLQRLVDGAHVSRHTSDMSEEWKYWKEHGWIEARGSRAVAHVLEARRYEVQTHWREARREPTNLLGEDDLTTVHGHREEHERQARKDEEAARHEYERREEQLKELEVMWHQYTDGAWEQPEDDSDGSDESRGGPRRPAGFGVCEFRLSPETDVTISLAQATEEGQEGGPWGTLTWTKVGQVETNEAEHTYIGASAQTNNTGELTGLYYALKRAQSRTAGEGKEVIRSDSLYALNMTTGKWKPRTRRNREIVSTLRAAWRAVQRKRPGEVRMEHVRSHVWIVGNETADWLAERGQNGEGATMQETVTWIDEWRRQHSGAARDEAAQASPPLRAHARDPSGVGDPEGVG